MELYSWCNDVKLMIIYNITQCFPITLLLQLGIINGITLKSLTYTGLHTLLVNKSLVLITECHISFPYDERISRRSAACEEILNISVKIITCT